MLESADMPITKSAQKALRQSLRKAKINKPIKAKARTLLKLARNKPTKENISKAFSGLDLAVKGKLFHINKASRLKSRLSHLIAKTG